MFDMFRICQYTKTITWCNLIFFLYSYSSNKIFKILKPWLRPDLRTRSGEPNPKIDPEGLPGKGDYNGLQVIQGGPFPSCHYVYVWYRKYVYYNVYIPIITWLYYIYSYICTYLYRYLYHFFSIFALKQLIMSWIPSTGFGPEVNCSARLQFSLTFPLQDASARKKSAEKAVEPQKSEKRVSLESAFGALVGRSLGLTWTYSTGWVGR